LPAENEGGEGFDLVEWDDLLDGEEDLDGLLIPAWNKRTSS
jgi:hypothetical protein